MPPIGLGYLSHAVKTGRGDETLIVDGRRFRLSDEAIIQRASPFEPDVIGVTALSCEAPQAASLISQLKQEWPHTPVILGGPHATAFKASLMERVDADYLVVGEGEDTLIELLDALEGKCDIAGVKGIIWRNGPEVVFNGVRPFIEDVDRLGVDWEAIEPDKYFGRWFRNTRSTVAKSARKLPIFTSRGCTYNCTYCHRIFGQKFRPFDTERTVSSMFELRDRYKVKEFMIVDDAFNLNIKRAKDFMNQIIERKLGCALSFPNGLRADIMDEELIDFMARAGTYNIRYAIESASPRIQKLVKKNLNLERAREIVNITASHRIITGTFNMLGFPDETEEEMKQTIDYVTSLKCHTATFFYLNPFPGTEMAESDPIIGEKVRQVDFSEYSGITLNLSAVPDDVLMKMKRSGYRKFYFSPRRIVRILRDVPKNPLLLVSAYAVLLHSYRENVHY